PSGMVTTATDLLRRGSRFRKSVRLLAGASSRKARARTSSTDLARPDHDLRLRGGQKQTRRGRAPAAVQVANAAGRTMRSAEENQTSPSAQLQKRFTHRPPSVHYPLRDTCTATPALS